MAAKALFLAAVVLLILASFFAWPNGSWEHAGVLLPLGAACIAGGLLVA